MPRTINGENSRKSIRVPASMIEEIDRIVMEYRGLGYNRQQFVESAIREKIERMQPVRGNNSKNTSS
jgi:metal-responsive CopG/Arc/MetJ family transcriptional regulator